MKELSRNELLEWLNLVFGKGFNIHILSEDLAEDNERSEQAYKQIRRLIEEKPKVTRKDIFGFHQNLTTIVEDSEDAQECYDREIDYIYHWLKSKGVDVEE